MITNTLQAIQDNQAQLDRLRSTFAGIASDVNLSNKDWRELMESGALASLSISRYRGHKSLGAADLGLEQAEFDEIDSILSLGYRLLLPKAVLGAFNSLETRSRQILRQYTLKVPAGYFLPVSAYDACAMAMNDAKRKFEMLVDELLVELPIHLQTIKAQYVILGDQVAKRLYNANLIAYSDRVTYADQFVERCMSTFPLESELRGQFRFDLRLSFVPMPYSNTQAEQPAFAEPSSDLLALRRAVIAEQTKIETEEIRGFITSIQSEVYTLVNEALTNVLDGIQDKGFLQSRSSVQLRGLVEKLGQLNFWQDPKLDLIKAEITTILDRAPQKRDIQLDQSLLATMQDEVKLTLLQLGTIERGDFNVASTQPAIVLPATRQAEPVTLKATNPQPIIAKPIVTSRQSSRLF